jgi:hypothetical protein
LVIIQYTPGQRIPVIAELNTQQLSSCLHRKYGFPAKGVSQLSVLNIEENGIDYHAKALCQSYRYYLIVHNRKLLIMEEETKKRG